MDDAEAQMRRALGLHGEGHRSRPDGDRQEPGQRMGGGGFTQGLHRRRFVQDGEVPVTVVRRDPVELPGGAPSGPTSSRLQRVEAALAAELAARDKADRALQETQAALQALRTKIGHHELERNEAVTTGRRDREENVSLREELAAARERLSGVEPRAEAAEAALRDLRSELNRERRARETAERRLENTMAERRSENAMAERRLENAMAERRLETASAERRLETVSAGRRLENATAEPEVPAKPSLCAGKSRPAAKPRACRPVAAVRPTRAQSRWPNRNRNRSNGG